MSNKSILKVAGALALAVMGLNAQAEAKKENFDDYVRILGNVWSALPKACEEPAISEVRNLEQFNGLEQRVNDYGRCLSENGARIAARKDAQRLVNPSIWQDLSDAQKKSLQDLLQKTNATLAAQLEERFARISREAMVAAEPFARERAQRRQEATRYESWIEAKRQDPNSLSADEFRDCMAAAGRIERMDDQVREMDARLDNKSFVIDTLKAMIQVGGSGMNSTRQSYNEAINEYNAIAKEKNRVLDRRESAFRRYDSGCQGNRVAPESMIEELCADGRDNPFCRGFD